MERVFHKQACLLLVLCLALLLVPSPSKAAVPSTLYVGDTQVDPSQSAQGDGWSYDGNGTLTLNNAQITGRTVNGNTYGISASGELTIHLPAGTSSSIVCPDASTEGKTSCAIQAGTLTVTGSGKLYTSSGAALGSDGCSYGMLVSGVLTVTSDAFFSCSSGEADKDSFGIHTYSDIHNMGSLEGRSGRAGKNSYGIFVINTSNKIDGLRNSGTIYGEGGVSEGAFDGSYGIYANCGVVNTGSLSGLSKSATYYSAGVWCGHGLTCSGGSVSGISGTGWGSTGVFGSIGGITMDHHAYLSGKGGAVTSDSCFSQGVAVNNGGIHVAGGSTLRAQSEAAQGDDGDSYGIAIRGGEFLVADGSSVNASGSTASGRNANSFGIYLNDDAHITGGSTVIASGGNVAGEPTCFSAGISSLLPITISIDGGSVLEGISGEASAVGDYGSSFGVSTYSSSDDQGGVILRDTSVLRGTSPVEAYGWGVDVVTVYGGTVTAQGGSAFYYPPVVENGYSQARVWFGQDSSSHWGGGENALRLDPQSYYTSPYVRIGPAEWKLGDANWDGNIDLSDAVSAARLAVDHSLASKLGLSKEAADVSGDGSVDVEDVLRLCRYLVGSTKTLSAE